MNAVSNEVVSNECGLKWMWFQMNRSQMNVVPNEVVSNERDLKWKSFKNGCVLKWKILERSGLNWTGLKRTWSQLKWSRINRSQMKVVSNERGLKWMGSNEVVSIVMKPSGAEAAFTTFQKLFSNLSNLKKETCWLSKNFYFLAKQTHAETRVGQSQR